MAIFTAEKFRIVKSGKLTFYKLFYNSKCLFDEFCDEINQNSVGKKELLKIYSYMNFLASENPKLPDTIFNSIKSKGKVIAYEFKAKQLRVYVYKQDKNLFVIMGGYKTNQKADIVKLEKLIDSAELKKYVENFSE